MRVRDWMSKDVESCVVDDTLNRAAQLMWEGDFGVVPVVGVGGAVVGMLTDRDICMAAYTRGRPIHELKVEDAMAKHITTCSEESTIETALSLMKEAHVRRLPIVDRHGRLAGILSLNDLARELRMLVNSLEGVRLRGELALVLAALCTPPFPGRSKEPSAPRVAARRNVRPYCAV